MDVEVVPEEVLFDGAEEEFCEVLKNVDWARFIGVRKENFRWTWNGKPR